MRILLDTHVYLWWLDDHPRLTKQARARIADASSVYVSSASIWEAAIKIGIGKLRAELDALVREISGSGFEELPVTSRHAAAVAALPDIHRDPFDRILLAQALSEPLRLLTLDGLLKEYSELVDVI